MRSLGQGRGIHPGGKKTGGLWSPRPDSAARKTQGGKKDGWPALNPAIPSGRTVSESSPRAPCFTPTQTLSPGALLGDVVPLAPAGCNSVSPLGSPCWHTE